MGQVYKRHSPPAAIVHMGAIIRSLFAIALPLAVFFGGGWLMQTASGRTDSDRGAGGGLPLNQRLRGYDVDAAGKLWESLGPTGRQEERRLLELDLVFPFAYGGALAAGLLIAWAGLGRGFSPVFVIGLVVLGMLADWTENLVQLYQLERFGRNEPLQTAWIAIASAATQVKLASLAIAFGALLVLAGLMPFLRRD